MTVITETLDLPDGTAPSGYVVTIALAGENGEEIEGFVSGENTTLVGRVREHLTDGAWSVDLIPNDDITPAGTVYKRTIEGPSGRGGARWVDYFDVPDAGGPYVLEDRLTDPPGDLPDPQAVTLSVLNDALGEIALVAAPTGVQATDEATFEAALAALPSTGGRLLLSRGTYFGRFAIDKPNVVLEAQGLGATTFKVPDGHDQVGQVLTIVADNVTVRDLMLDGNRDEQDYGGTTTRESDGIGIYANKVLIDHCYVKRSAGHGIIIWDEATSTHHGAPNATAAAGGRSHCTIRDCIIEDNGHTLDNRSAIDIATSTANVDHKVLNNTVLFGDYTSSGVTMHAGSRTIIDGNIIVCTAKERAMMVHTGSYGCRVVNNIAVKKTATNGAQFFASIASTCTDTLFEGNYFESDRNDAAFANLSDTCTALLFANNRAKFSSGATGTVAFLRLGSTITTNGVRLRSNHTLNADKPVYDVDGSAAVEAAVSVLDQWESNALIAATAAPLETFSKAIQINPLGIATNTGWSGLQVDTQAFLNGWRESTGTQNDEVSWEIPLGAGTWSIEMLHTTNNNRGIYSVQIDGVEVGTIDGYSASAVRNVKSTLTGIAVATSSLHVLKLKMATKNASSSQYRGSVILVSLLRTA